MPAKLNRREFMHKTALATSAVSLAWDANKEIITNSSAGNNLLSYDYRAPWQLPNA